uniref:Putative homing endonuclease n=1 Tax=viral metagenome TaxID=1070528 RepID=A0A6H1ZIK1_9ZZZZ
MKYENKEWRRNYYLKNRERILQYRKKYYIKNKEKVNADNEEWKKNNREKMRKYSLDYYYRNKNEIDDKNKKYRELNKDKIKEYGKQYRGKNKDAIKERNRIYQIKNRDKANESVKRYRINNPIKIKTQKQLRRSMERGVEANFSNEQWISCLKYFNNRCAYCGKKENIEQDHFVALLEGGEYTINNIIPACKSCNSSKRHQAFMEWYLRQNFYSETREKKIFRYLGIYRNVQQMKLTI